MVDMKFWKPYDVRITLYSGVLGVAEEFALSIAKSYMRKD